MPSIVVYCAKVSSRIQGVLDNFMHAKNSVKKYYHGISIKLHVKSWITQNLPLHASIVASLPNRFLPKKDQFHTIKSKTECRKNNKKAQRRLDMQMRIVTQHREAKQDMKVNIQHIQ